LTDFQIIHAQFIIYFPLLVEFIDFSLKQERCQLRNPDIDITEMNAKSEGCRLVLWNG
jgi:hypothetical protein